MSGCYQIILELASTEPIPEGKLEDMAERCLTALNRDARFAALGPVVSADFARSVIEVEFTAAGETVEDVNNKIAHVARVMQEALREQDDHDDFAYNKSKAERLVTA